MEFLKNHYEKVVLGIVLLALAAVAVWLPVKIQSDKQDVAATLHKYDTPPNAKALPPTDLSKEEKIREQTKQPPDADFSGKHNLFNPVKWIKTPEGVLEKHASNEEHGPKLVQVEQVHPLAFIVEYERRSGSGYNFKVTRESAERPSDRRPRTYYASEQSKKNDVFTLLSVNGPEDDPLTFELEVNDTGDRFVVPHNKPYSATNGYSADLSYPPEKKTWKDARVKQPLVFDGDTNIVVDINPREVILRAVSNEKTTTIPINAAH